jgi:uncharacterized protein with PQ loop repeat
MLNFLLNLLPSLAGIVLAFCYVPQIRTTLRTKNVEGMDLRFWVILDVALFMLFTNAVVVFLQFGTWGYMVTEAFNLGLALVVTGLVLKYRKKEVK